MLVFLCFIWGVIGEDGKNSVNSNDIEAIAIIIIDDGWIFGGGIERAIGTYIDWQQTRVEENQTLAGISANTLPLDSVTAYTDNYWRASIGLRLCVA